MIEVFREKIIEPLLYFGGWEFMIFAGVIFLFCLNSTIRDIVKGEKEKKDNAEGGV